MRMIRERFAHVPKSRQDGVHAHAVFHGNTGGHAGRVGRNGRNGAGGGRGRGRGGNDHLSMSKKCDYSAVQAERRTRDPLTGRTRNAGHVGRMDTSDPSVKRSSAEDAEEPGTGLSFAHP